MLRGQLVAFLSMISERAVHEFARMVGDSAAAERISIRHVVVLSINSLEYMDDSVQDLLIQAPEVQTQEIHCSTKSIGSASIAFVSHTSRLATLCVPPTPPAGGPR